MANASLLIKDFFYSPIDLEEYMENCAYDVFCEDCVKKIFPESVVENILTEECLYETVYDTWD